MNILLCCSGGISTSILVQKMKEAAHQQNLEVKIRAVSAAEVNKWIAEADVLLLGPQVRFLLERVREVAERHAVPVDAIKAVDYGMMNGENVLNQAIRLIKEAKGK